MKKILTAIMLLSIILSGCAIEVEVPDLSCMSMEDVKKWGEENEIIIITNEEESTKVKKGSYLSQSVEPKTSIKKGSEIEVVYSSGFPKFEVPNFSGQSIREMAKYCENNNIESCYCAYYENGDFVFYNDEIINDIDNKKWDLYTVKSNDYGEIELGSQIQVELAYGQNYLGYDEDKFIEEMKQKGFATERVSEDYFPYSTVEKGKIASITGIWTINFTPTIKYMLSMGPSEESVWKGNNVEIKFNKDGTFTYKKEYEDAENIVIAGIREKDYLLININYFSHDNPKTNPPILPSSKYFNGSEKYTISGDVMELNCGFSFVQNCLDEDVLYKDNSN